MDKREKKGIAQTIEDRPTETVTGLALAAAVYGFLTQAGLDTAIAALIGVVIAFGPLLVSNVVDALRGMDDAE